MHDLAKNEIERLLCFQDERGFIPFYIYEGPFHWYRTRDWIGWERFFAKGWLPQVVPIAGPPVLAQAVRAIGDREFFLRYAQHITAFYQYFPRWRDLDGDGLISIITPREGGRDSAPEYDFFRALRMPRPLRFLDMPLDLFSLALLELRYKLIGWDERKILESNIFNVQDLAVQCIYIDGLYDLKWMMTHWGAGYTLYPDIEAVTLQAEKAVLKKCWNEEDRVFYSLRNGVEQLKELTVASLFPLLIKSLSPNQTQALADALLDDSKFNVPYPVPSVGVLHPEFNPLRTFPLWRGPTWMNTNWFLIRGLVRNGRRDIAEHIVHRSVEMVEKNGFREFYHPYTGKGLRVKNFGWSTLAVTLLSLCQTKIEMS